MKTKKIKKIKTKKRILQAWDEGFKFPILEAMKEDKNLKLALEFLGLEKNLKSANIDDIMSIVIEVINGNIGDFEIVDDYKEIYMNNSNALSKMLPSYSYQINECFYSDIVQDVVAHFIIKAFENFANKEISYYFCK